MTPYELHGQYDVSIAFINERPFHIVIDRMAYTARAYATVAHSK